MRLHRLLPDPASIELDEQLATLDVTGPPGARRPYVVANLAVTADGRAAVAGTSGPIGDEGDRALFFGLRGLVDAVLAGTGTLRAEPHGPLAGGASRRAARVRRGLAPQPILTTITRSGDLPHDIALLADPESSFVAYTGRPTATPVGAARAEVVALDPCTARAALDHLRAHHGARSVLCEGGPTLLGGLLGEGVVDELFLTLAPRLRGGGTEPRLVEGAPLPQLTGLDLRWVLEREGSLFLRYAVRSAHR